MLTREGFVAADMSGHIVLQRSSWKAEAIRRGDLKISGPIPITEDIPLNPEEEKDFVPIDAHVNSDHSKDELEQQEQNPVLPPHPSQPPPSIPEQASALSSNPVEGQTQTRADFPAIRATMSSPLLRQVEHVQRDSVLQPSANASPTPFRSTPESTTKASQKRKRKSGLRNVFRKMFGRKSRDEADGLEEEISNRENSYHPSDTGLAGQSPPREKRVPTGPRISELPVEELQPLHPIGRQLPFPMNVNAPQASPPSEYLHFDRPRRATLPILPGASSQRHSMDDTHGRLTAWEERTEDDGLSSPGIGIALSSPTQATPIRHKRRSRSADALFDIGKERESIDRGQSMELRHWRASYMSGSIYSRPQTAKTVETMRSVQAQEPVIQEQGSGSITGMSATLVTADEPEASELEKFREDSQLGAHASVSAFNFGNFQDMSAAEKYGSEIPSNTTSPPRSQEHKPAEDRVQHSEDSYEHLDGSVRRMSVRNNRSTIILENAPKSLRTRNRSTSRSASASRSRSTTLSIHQAPFIQPGGDTTNPEVAQSHPVVGGLHSELDDKQVLRTMQEALKHERAARQVLEQQVRNLQRDVSDLHGLVNKLIASASTTSPSYLTPSPDTLIVNSNEDRLMTPRAGHYDHNKGDMRESFLSRFSRSETGSESDYEQQSLKPSRSHDEVQTPDIWATPKEERFGGGFFQSGEERKAFA